MNHRARTVFMCAVALALVLLTIYGCGGGNPNDPTQCVAVRDTGTLGAYCTSPQ